MKSGFYASKISYFDVLHINERPFYEFVMKCRLLLPKHFLVGIFKQLLGSEVINIKSWKFNWECTITIKEKSRSFRSIPLFWVDQGFPTGRPQMPPPPSWLVLKELAFWQLFSCNHAESKLYWVFMDNFFCWRSS